MASPQDIGKLKRNINETWEESFQGVKKNSDEFYKLVEEFTNFVGDWKEFSDLRRDQLAEYIDKLGDVSKHWEEINEWIEENNDSTVDYVGSLSDIRNLFQSIVAEASTLRKRTQDNVRVFRDIANLSNDSILALKAEGGLTDRIVGSLSKKNAKVQEEYKTRLQLLGVTEDLSNLPLILRQEQKRLDLTNERLKRLDRIAKQQGFLNAIEREQKRTLEQTQSLQLSNLELLNDYNRKAIDWQQKLITGEVEYWKAQRRGTRSSSRLEDAGENGSSARSTNMAAKFLRKLGMTDESQVLLDLRGRWETDRVQAKLNTDVASKAVEIGQENVVRNTNRRNTDLVKAGSESRKIAKSLAESTSQRDITSAALDQAQAKLDKIRNSLAETNPILDQWGQPMQQFSEEDLGEAQAEVDRLKGNLKSINDQIKNITEHQEELNRALGNSNVNLNVANETLKTAKENLTAAEAEEKKVFSIPFSAKVSEFLAKDLPNLIAKLGILLGALIYRQLLKFDEEAVKTKRVIGQWADASALANTKFVTGTEVLKTMRDLGEQFHINPVQVFSSQELGRIAEAQKLTGMSAQAAGNLGVQSKIIGKNADSYRDSIAAGANQANKLNHSAVNLSAVQNDVLNTSRAITMSYGQNVEGLARAASTAASLGMNLQDVENISRNLINFQSSIEAEMQAQLLTGQQLNLARARELALNNDLEGVAREISSQGVDAAKFSHMNLIQQENMAKALGMSREQMSKMLIMQEINKGLTAQQVAAMTGMRKEDIEALSAQEKWQTMKQRFLETLVPLLEPVLQVVSDIFRLLTPIVGAISWILGKVSTLGGIIKEDHVFLRALVGTLAIGIPVALLKGISLVGVLGKAFKGLAKVGVSVGKSIAGWATNLATAGKNAQATGGILGSVLPQRDYQGRTAQQRLRDIRKLEATKSVNPAGAAATSRASASMGSTISKIGKNIGKIALGAAAAVLIAGAVFILAKAAQEFMKVSWGAMAKAGVALLGLVGIVAAVGAIMSSQIGTVLILAGAAAMVVMAGAVALLGVALKTLDGINWEGFKGIGKAMWSLASAGIAAMVAGPALMVGAIKLIPGAYALAQAFKVLATAEDVNTANILQTIKDLKSIEIPEVSNFQRLQKIAQVLVRTSRRLRNASFKPLENLSNLGTGLSSTANALVRVGEAIGLIATNLNQLDSEKLSSLRSSRLSGSLARIRSRLQERVENLKENTGSQKETIAAANQEVTVKKANQNTATQQISIEQRATDLKVIERKLDNVIAAIGNSRPDWDWVKFEQARTRNLSWVK